MCRNSNNEPISNWTTLELYLELMHDEWEHKVVSPGARHHAKNFSKQGGSDFKIVWYRDKSSFFRSYLQCLLHFSRVADESAEAAAQVEHFKPDEYYRKLVGGKVRKKNNSADGY